MTSLDEPTSADDVPAVEPVPGEVERVPLKVVPIFVQPIEDEPPVEPDEELFRDEPAPKPRTTAFAASAVLLALGTVAVHIAAIVVASAGDFPTGTLLGYIAIGLSAVAFVAGVVAIIRRRAPAWAIVAVIIAVLANPLVLLTVLRFLSGLQT